MPLKWEYPKCQEKRVKKPHNAASADYRKKCLLACCSKSVSLSTIQPHSKEPCFREQLTHFPQILVHRIVEIFLDIFSLFLGYTSWTNNCRSVQQLSSFFPCIMRWKSCMLVTLEGQCIPWFLRNAVGTLFSLLHQANEDQVTQFTSVCKISPLQIFRGLED